MDDYAAIVDRETCGVTIVDVGAKPYWSTNGAGRQRVLGLGQRRRQGRRDRLRDRPADRDVPVGDHPQRVRAGFVARDILRSLALTRPDDDQVS